MYQYCCTTQDQYKCKKYEGTEARNTYKHMNSANR